MRYAHYVIFVFLCIWVTGASAAILQAPTPVSTITITLRATPQEGPAPLSGSIVGAATTSQGYFSEVRWFINGQHAAGWAVEEVTIASMQGGFTIREATDQVHRFEAVDNLGLVHSAETVIHVYEPEPTATPTATPSPATIVEVSPGNLTVPYALTGLASVEIDVNIVDVNTLSAYYLELSYGGSPLEIRAPEDVAFGDFIGRFGGSIAIFGPAINNQAGRLEMGMTTTEGIPSTGEGNLFSVTFSVLPVDRRTEVSLVLRNPDLRDWQGDDVPATLKHGNVTVCFWADLNCDDKVDIIDLQRVATRWNSVQGDLDYDVRYDPDRDGDIDINDIQKIAGRWNEAGPFEP